MVTGYSFDDRQWGNVIAWCGVVWPFDRRCCTSVCDKTDNPIETDNTGRHRRQNAANRKSLNKTKLVVQPTDSRHVAKSKTPQRILEQNLQGKETLCFPKVDFNFQVMILVPMLCLRKTRIHTTNLECLKSGPILKLQKCMTSLGGSGCVPILDSLYNARIPGLAQPCSTPRGPEGTCPL